MSRLRYEPGPTPVSNDPRVLREWISREFLRIAENMKPIQIQTTWNPGSLSNNSTEELDIDFPQAELGDVAIAAFSLDTQGLILAANVQSAGTITVTLTNNSGGAIDLGEGTLTVRLL